MKRKRTFYVPGLISLIGIPVLALSFSHNYKYSKSTSIKLSIPSDHKSDDNLFIFSKDNFYQSIKRKKIIQVDLNEASVPEQSYLFQNKLDFIKREIERLQFTNDTTSVLKVRLGSNNTYGHFIWILKQALIYQLKRYVYVDNDFYLLANPPSLVEYKPTNADTSAPVQLEL